MTPRRPGRRRDDTTVVRGPRRTSPGSRADRCLQRWLIRRRGGASASRAARAAKRVLAVSLIPNDVLAATLTSMCSPPTSARWRRCTTNGVSVTTKQASRLSRTSRVTFV